MLERKIERPYQCADIVGQRVGQLEQRALRKGGEQDQAKLRAMARTDELLHVDDDDVALIPVALALENAQLEQRGGGVTARRPLAVETEQAGSAEEVAQPRE